MRTDTEARRSSLIAMILPAKLAAVATVAASLTVALDAPAWLATTLSALAFLLIARHTVRRRIGWADAIATGTAGLVIVLMLLGFLLDVVPGGLNRISWAVGAGVVALAALAWSGRRSAPERVALPLDARTSFRLVPAYAAGGVLAAVALIISVHATRLATQPPLALSIVGTAHSGQVTVEISAGSNPGRYELTVSGQGGGVGVVAASFELGKNQRTTRTVNLPAGPRSVVAVRSTGSASPLRTLVVSPDTLEPATATP